MSQKISHDEKDKNLTLRSTYDCERRGFREDLMGTNHIMHKQLRVTPGSLCAMVTKEFLHLRVSVQPVEVSHQCCMFILLRDRKLPNLLEFIALI